MKVFVFYGIKTLLVQNPLFPKTVRFFIKLFLEITSQNILYLTGSGLAIVEGKKLQQMHLCGI